MELVRAQPFILRLLASGSLLTNLDADWWRYLRNSHSDRSAGEHLTSAETSPSAFKDTHSAFPSLMRARPTKTSQREECCLQNGLRRCGASQEILMKYQ